jgi:membrane protease YdiL (CAAX protease family)
MIRVAALLLLLFVERLIAYFGTLNLWEWIFVHTVIYSLLPLVFVLKGKIKGGEVGLSTGEFRTGLKYVGLLLALAMPFMLYGASLPSFKSYYPIWEPARTEISSFILLELAVMVMMFNTEFFYRGLLIFSLERELKKFNLSKWTAILIQAAIYMIVHLGKPGLEVPYSFFVGIVFGWLALRTRSILPSYIAHYISSVIFDLLVIFI